MEIMARQAIEALARSYTQAAVAHPEAKPHMMLWVGTWLSIADVPLLVGEGQLDEIIETPVLTGIPGTKPWVLGVGVHRGCLLPVFSGDAFFRKTPYTGRVRENCMVIRRPGFYCAITLSSVERTLKLPIEQRDMEHSVDSDFRGFSLGGFSYQDQFLSVLDIDKLVTNDDFSNASTMAESSVEEKAL